MSLGQEGLKMNNVDNSINRAKELFKASNQKEEYVSIKIKPIGGGCCCLHCWPSTWDGVNEYIKPNSHIEDEGDALIKTTDAEYVLECHESGPEIIVLIDRIVNYSGFIISLTGLIIILLQSRDRDRKKQHFFEIIKRQYKKGKLKEEVIISIDSDKIEKRKIEEILRQSIKGK